jgi:hypothetical protein
VGRCDIKHEAVPDCGSFEEDCGNCGASWIRHQGHALAIALNDQPMIS